MKPSTGASSQKAKLPKKCARAGSRFAVLRGTRGTGKSTDEIMNQLRGYLFAVRWLDITIYNL